MEDQISVMENHMSVDATPRRKLNFDKVDKEKEFTNVSMVEQRNGNHSGISIDKIPKIGMEFESEDSAYKFYNEYAKAMGFGIRKHSAHKDRNGRVLDRIFCCECQGQRGKDKRDALVKCHRPETRTGCEASMKINGRYTGKYKVVGFVAQHIGHDLVSPRKSHMKRSHRKISDVQASLADDIDSSGIAPKAGFALLSKQVGNRENVGFMFEDYKNYLGSKRTMEMKAGDTGGVLEYLQQRQLDDPNFFYAIQVDQDDLIANILWVDAKMKVDCVYFGDVVCFDTTYKKNKEGKPFSLFVGVNHHRQTIVFGAALLYAETTSTFTWLFDTFARAMSGKLPETILTDQDAAIAKALATQWPETFHRLCIWHIYQNAAKHLSHVFARSKDFSKDFRSCVYDYEEEEEFLSAWHVMLEKYGLEDNDWLARLFKVREKWALVYGRKTFCADMISTQQSESMNSALKRYVNYKHNLLQFLRHFDRLVDDRRYEELKADFRTSQSIPVATFPVQILKHASSSYTHEVLELFQEELHKAYDCQAELYSQFEENFEYKVTPFKKHYQHTVLFSSSEGIVSCNCKRFEFAGILCSHVLKVFSFRNIVEIPHLYIKKRWTKNAKKNIVEGVDISVEPLEYVNDNEEKRMIAIHYKELCSLYNQLTTRGALTKQTFEIAKKYFIKGIEEVDACLENSRSTSGLKFVVQKNIHSRVADKQAFAFTSEGGGKKTTDKDGQLSNQSVIKGWKNMEKKGVRSGKRERSGLEKSRQKKKQCNSTSSIENKDKMQQNVDDHSSNVSNVGASFECNVIPSLSQLSQVFNPIVNQQHNFAHYSNQVQSQMSLTLLLQQQLMKTQGHVESDFNNSRQRKVEEANNENRNGDNI